jgi:hypothetical protein
MELAIELGKGESEASPILNSRRVDLAQNPLADVSTRHAQEVEERALALLASSDVMSCTSIDAPEGPKRRLCSCKKSKGQQGGAVGVATGSLSPAAFIGPRSEEGESHENIPIERCSEPSPGRLEGSEGSELENSELIDQRLDLPKSSPNVDSKLHSTGPVVPKAAPAPGLSLQRLSTISLVEDECISELVLPPPAHPFLLHKANTGLGFALQEAMGSSIPRLCGESYISSPPMSLLIGDNHEGWAIELSLSPESLNSQPVASKSVIPNPLHHMRHRSFSIERGHREEKYPSSNISLTPISGMHLLVLR